MMFTVLPLGTLPDVPEHFIERAKALVRDPGNRENRNNQLLRHLGYHDRDIRLADGTMTKSRIVENYGMGQDWEDWVRANIIADFVETGVRHTVSNPQHPETSIQGPHVDVSTPTQPHKLKLFYIVEEGGDNVLTTWYQEKNHPTVRLDSTSENIVHSNDYRNLISIQTVRIPRRSWVVFDTRVMHGVENMFDNRIVLIVGVDPNAVTFEVKPKPLKG